jgi:hypothetical protein
MEEGLMELLVNKELDEDRIPHDGIRGLFSRVLITLRNKL